MVRELGELYRAGHEGREVELPPLELQVGDVAVWQRDWLRSEELKAQLDAWKRQLAGIPASLQLPTDRPRPARQTYRGARLPVSFPSDLVDRLRRVARGRGATLYMALPLRIRHVAATLQPSGRHLCRITDRRAPSSRSGTADRLPCQHGGAARRRLERSDVRRAPRTGARDHARRLRASGSAVRESSSKSCRRCVTRACTRYSR